MTVAWNQAALDDRAGYLEAAWQRALALPDPQIFAAAVDQDTRIEVEGENLDGGAFYRQGPLPDSYIYPTHGGRFVLLYRRIDDDVEIERVLPSRSNWQAHAS